MREGIRQFDPAEQTDDGEAACAFVETLEGQKIKLLLDLGGVRAESTCGDGETTSNVYDSVSSFLINNSEGFKAHFNASLFAALRKVAAEREAEEATAPE